MRDLTIELVGGSTRFANSYSVTLTPATTRPARPAPPPPGWQPLGATVVTAGSEAGSVIVTAPVRWAGGLVGTNTTGCDYRVETDARIVERLDPGQTLSGFGVVARAQVSATGVTDGRGLQYEDSFGRVRDVDYTQPDAAPNQELLTDNGWHHIAIEVSGTTYRSEVDGELVFSGTTTAACAGAPWLRIWEASVEVRNLTVTAVDPATTTPAIAELGDALDVADWTAVGGTTISPTADGFVLEAASLYWSGARAAAPSCDYRFSGEGRAIAGHGYGFVAHAEFDGAGAAVNGHGIQYDPEAGGYRDVEFPEVERADHHGDDGRGSGTTSPSRSSATGTRPSSTAPSCTPGRRMRSAGSCTCASGAGRRSSGTCGCNRCRSHEVPRGDASAAPSPARLRGSADLAATGARVLEHLVERLGRIEGAFAPQTEGAPPMPLRCISLVPAAMAIWRPLVVGGRTAGDRVVRGPRERLEP